MEIPRALPIVNKRMSKSITQRNKLEAAILETIRKVEIENDYSFEPFEIDYVLLEMIKRNHAYYLR